MRKRLNCLSSCLVVAAAFGLATVKTGVADGAAERGAGSFDIRPFSLPNTPPNQVWFEEPRDITRLVVEFDKAVPDDILVSYQRKVWPGTRLEEAARSHPGGFGWVHQDDWFNGQWQRAAVCVNKLSDRRAEITFSGIAAELSEVEVGDAEVTFRRSCAVQVTAQGNPTIKSVYTASARVHSDLRVELDAGVTTWLQCLVAAKHASRTLEERKSRGGTFLFWARDVAHHGAAARPRAGDDVHDHRAERGVVG